MKQLERPTIPWPVFAVTVAAAFMVALDLSIVNVAFPSIRQSFPEVSTATLSWVLAAYSVVFGALLLGAGRIADRSGRRRIFLLGLMIFTAGSLLCGLAPSAWMLIVGRVVQALGAALLMPASLALLLSATAPAARGQAVAMWGGVAALGGRHRPLARLGPHRRRRVALGVLRQPPRRPRRRHRRPTGRARIEGGRSGSRPRRGGAVVSCGGGPRPGDHPRR